MMAGLVLAGGRSSRFGAEKAVASWNGGVLMDAPLDALRRTCSVVAVSARTGSGAATHAAKLELICLHDATTDAEGPLAGLRAGLEWARDAGMVWLSTAPCDAPTLSAALYRSLQAALMPDTDAVVATSPRGWEPLVAIWRVEAGLQALEHALSDIDHPAVKDILAGLGASQVGGYDCLNVNRPGDLAAMPHTI